MRKKLFIIYLLFFTSNVFAEVKEVNNQEIISLIKNKVPIIDIRRSDEWIDTGIIEQSHLITFFDKKDVIVSKNGFLNLEKLQKRGIQ